MHLLRGNVKSVFRVIGVMKKVNKMSTSVWRPYGLL